jgi:hypothetical protein
VKDTLLIVGGLIVGVLVYQYLARQNNPLSAGESDLQQGWDDIVNEFDSLQLFD